MIQNDLSQEERRHAHEKRRKLQQDAICCSKMCLFKSKDGMRSLNQVFQMLVDVKTRYEALSPSEKKVRLISEVEKGYRGLTSSSRIQLELRLNPEEGIVCSKAFQTAWDIGHATFERICKTVKDRVSGHTEALTPKNQRKIVEDYWKATKQHFGISVDCVMHSLSILPDTPIAIQTFVWMQEYFHMVGEHLPNDWAQVTLDSSITKKNIYKEYV